VHRFAQDSGDDADIMNLEEYHQNATINIMPLKKFAYEKVSNSSHLRNILLSEKEILTVSEFLAKMDVWLKVLHSEGGK
jgi:hypothetical protein